MGANDKLREHLIAVGIEREIVDFVVGVENLRVARGCQPLPVAAIPVAQIRAEAKDCLTVAAKLAKQAQVAELLQRQAMAMPQHLVSAKTTAPAQPPAGIQSRPAVRDERGQPSAVSKALSRLETQRAMTMYWDPEGIDDPSY